MTGWVGEKAARVVEGPLRAGLALFAGPVLSSAIMFAKIVHKNTQKTRSITYSKTN